MKGPPTRPVCGAIVSSNYRISHFLSSMLRPLINAAPTVCDSTEDMLYRIRECNQQQDLQNSVVGSMDVTALYPSIDIVFAVSICVELLHESSVEFSSVDFNEVGLFLALTTSNELLEEVGLGRYCPRRGTKRGRHPTLRAETIRNTDKRWAQWIRSEETPSDVGEIRRMVCYAVGISLIYTLKNHIFKFNGVYYKQPEGGAIGVGIAGDVATLFMVWYDRQLLAKLRDDNIIIQLYARYVDDINIVAKKIVDDEPSEPADKSTMVKVQQIANTIHDSIKVTVDYPSNHDNGRMPVLDLEQWIQPVMVGDEMKSQIMHSHYSKPMSSKHVVNKDSALPMSTKMNVLTADLVRVMRNVSQQCREEERKRHVQEYMHRMQFSGYSTEDRIGVYKKAKSRYEKMIQDDVEGTTPLYRAKQWNREKRLKEKASKRKEWFAKNGDETVMFVEATPGSALAKEFKTILNSCKINIKVVERTGVTIKEMLTRSDPFRIKECGCGLCSAESKVNCKTREAVYKISCAGCQEFYIGETSRSIGQRYEEHLAQSRNRNTNSVFEPHFREKHEGEQQNLNLDVMKTCPGDPMLRQCTEATMIRELKPTLNSKIEWRRVTSTR